MAGVPQDPAEDISDEDYRLQVSKRTKLRRQITTALNRMDAIITSRGPRSGLSALLRHVGELVNQAYQLQTELSALETEEESERQDNIHLGYIERFGQVSDASKAYYASRGDEASVVEEQLLEEEEEDISASEVGRRQAALADAQARADEAAGNAERARQQAEEAQLALQRLNLEEDRMSSVSQRQPNPSPLANDLKLRQRKLNVPTSSEAPDDWIDRYAAGHLRPSIGSSSRSSVKTELEVYTGKSLDWFEWIDLFRALVHDTGKFPGEKLAILKRHLKGDCANLVHGLGGGEPAYIEALVRLKQSYGRRDVMRATHIQAIEKMELKNDPAAFKRFAEKIRTHLFDLSRIGESSSPDLIEKICLRLQLQDRLAWNDGRHGGLETRSLNVFGSWLCSRAAAYQNAYSIAAEQLNVSTPKYGSRPQARTHQASTSPKSVQFQSFCFKCEGNHKLEHCSKFKSLVIGDRIAFCARHRLCFGCLGAKHSVRFCNQKKPCKISGCHLHHHDLLHDPARVADSVPTESTREATARIGHTSPQRVAMGMMRLKILNADGDAVWANAFIDEGSDSTLMRQGFASANKIFGVHQILTVEGAGGVVTKHRSQRVDFQINTDSGETVSVRGSTLPSTVASTTPVTDWGVLKKRWSHLSDLPVGKTGGRVDILIGQDLNHLTVALESRVGNDYEPTAIRSRLGWLIRGVIADSIAVSAVRIHNVTSSTQLEDIASELRRFCDTENFGTESTLVAMSADDRQAVSILESGTRKLDLGYEVPITWKTGEPSLVCNRQMAQQRLDGLLRRFSRDAGFEADYRAAVQKTIDKGYATILSEEESCSAKYFLAHHGVYKGPKLRVFFDAAAPFQGKCLNDAILSGPALQPSLPSVLTQFREGTVAWASDVEAMFSRFRLNPSDANYFCFLWQDLSAKPVVCRMDRLPFGATCSPFIAIHTTHRAVADAEVGEGAVNAVKKKMYVDDYLGSARNVEEGLKEASIVRKALADADLHFQGWISNSEEFVRVMQGERNPISPDVLLIDDGNKKVLGVVWNTRDDTLGFRVDNMKEEEYTRVSLTSKVATVFDPLGLAAPLIVKAKVRLRELGVKGLRWSDPADETDRVWWESWFAIMRKLIHVSIERCLFPEETEIINSQLHVFGDASEEAYAAVVYLRNTYNSGQVIIRLVKASSKLAPKKTLSVPKLELNAALLSSRVAAAIQSCIIHQVHQRFFWTDSSTVRNWIRATASFYQIFVSNRIGEIQTLTETEEWRFVPGRLNPADAATRSAIGEEVWPKIWQDGPEFLLKPEADWPTDLPWLAATAELKNTKQYSIQAAADPFDWSEFRLDQTNISSFLKLDGSALKFVKQCQMEAFADDIYRLKAGKALRTSSHLLALSPTMGEDGLLRLGGRIGRAKLPYDARHPPLLPNKHLLTERVVRILHDQMHHAGTDYLFSKLCQHFWIIRGRELVKKTRRLCLQCIKERAAPAAQMMGNLPAERLNSYSPPFTHVAVDYFGPIETSAGRNRVVKRYGALFTCLVTRAVHLELAESLSAEDFLLVFRRFIGLFGKPASVHSDNGTNFVGAERELNELVLLLNDDPKLVRFRTEKLIDWHFQPPRAPHFGGAHESLVRSTKRALYRALDLEKAGLRYPTDEMMRTLLAEIAGFLNARPLTYASSDPEDFRPLTPNDFLNRPPTSDLLPGSFDDALPRERFRHVQRMAQLFWDLWTKLYLPSLVPRKKWQSAQQNLSVGDVVMMLDPNQPRGQWKIGHVSQVHPGEDGLVRVVKVQTEDGVYSRAIHRLCLLERAPISDAESKEAPINAQVTSLQTIHCLYLKRMFSAL